MPQKGFKSITVSEEVYDRLYDIFQRNNFGLALKGITSFSGYCTNILEKTREKDEIFSKYKQVIELMIIEESRIILKDNRVNRIVELVFENGKEKIIHCLHCDSYKCSHIGFCCSLDEIYPFKLKEELR